MMREATMKPSNDGVADLQRLVDRIKLEGSQSDPSAVDQVAENIRLRLNLSVDQHDEHIFHGLVHGLAAQLLNVNLNGTGKGYDATVISESTGISKSPRGEPQLQSTWSTETTSTSSSLPERMDSPDAADPAIVIDTSPHERGTSNAGLRRGRSPTVESRSDKMEEGRPTGMRSGSLRRSASPFRNFFGWQGKDSSAHISPANAPLLSRSMEGSRSFRGRNSLKPPMSPFPSTLNDSFGSSLPATPGFLFSPLGRNAEAPPSSRPYDRGDHVESVTNAIPASRPACTPGRGRSRSPVPRLNTLSRSKSAPRIVQRTSSLRNCSPSRIFSRSGTHERKPDMSVAGVFAAETIDDALPKQEIPKSSPLKTPASRMSSTGNDLLTGKGKMRRKMETSPTSAAPPPTVGAVDGGGLLFKVDLSKPTNRKQEAGNKRNTGIRKTKTSSRNGEANVQEARGLAPAHLQPQAPLAARKVEVSSYQQVPGSIPSHFQPQTSAFDSSAPMAQESLPMEPTLSPMELDSDTGLDEVARFSIGDSGIKPKRRPAKLGPRAHTKRHSEKPRHLDTVNAAVRTAPKPATSNEQPYHRKSMEIEHIKTLEENARKLLHGKDYKNSISWYSNAITSFSALAPGLLPGDTLSALLFGRAEGYLSITAVEAAILDCKNALAHVSEPSQSSSLDFNKGPILRARVHIRMARALRMAGKTNEASSEFEKAIATSEQLMTHCSICHTSGESVMIKAKLSEIMTDGVLGIQEVSQLQEAIDQLSSIKLPSLQPGRPCLDDRKRFVEALAWVRTALLKAPCCVDLHETKVALLVSLRRWHEVAGHCERLAVGTLLIEGISRADIEARKLLFDTPAAKELDALFFGDPKKEDFFLVQNFKAAEKSLQPSKSVAEAFLRLPRTLMRAYLRSLRLEERYSAEVAAIKALQSLLDSKKDSHDGYRLATEFTWLSAEKSKVLRTKDCRDRGDQLFKEGDYDMAAAQYAACLKIDSERELDGPDGGGGRLHAVLHCNRAACLMALGKHEEAVHECSAALRIHTRYMKAIMRRARCFQRLHRWEEAAAEYKKYLDLVNAVKTATESSAFFVTQCLFDGPEKASEEDIGQARDEAREVERKANAAREDRDAQEKFKRAFDESRRNRDRWQASSGFRHWDFNDKNRTKRSPFSDNNGTKRSPQQPQGQSNFRGGYQASGREYESTLGKHHRVLEVPFGASQKDIRKAYVKLALKFHPDKNKEPDAQRKTQEINAAYEALKEEYDSGRRR